MVAAKIFESVGEALSLPRRTQQNGSLSSLNGIMCVVANLATRAATSRPYPEHFKL